MTVWQVETALGEVARSSRSVFCFAGGPRRASFRGRDSDRGWHPLASSRAGPAPLVGRADGGEQGASRQGRRSEAGHQVCDAGRPRIVTVFLSASFSKVAKFFEPGGCPRGLPDWLFLKSAPRGGLPYLSCCFRPSGLCDFR